MNKSFIETFIIPKTNLRQQNKRVRFCLLLKIKIKNDFAFLFLCRQEAETEKRKKVGKLWEWLKIPH